MTETKPSMSPASVRKGANAAQKAATNVPTEEPPQAVSASADCGCETENAAAIAASPPAALADAFAAVPSLTPEGISAGGVTAAWHSNVHVTGLWGINQDRNSWVYLDKGGWKKLSTRTPTGIMAMTIIAGHAYTKGSVSSLHEADDGQISQLYVW